VIGSSGRTPEEPLGSSAKLGCSSNSISFFALFLACFFFLLLTIQVTVCGGMWVIGSSGRTPEEPLGSSAELGCSSNSISFFSLFLAFFFCSPRLFFFDFFSFRVFPSFRSVSRKNFGKTRDTGNQRRSFQVFFLVPLQYRQLRNVCIIDIFTEFSRPLDSLH
jgi:hypothetical protein